MTLEKNSLVRRIGRCGANFGKTILIQDTDSLYLLDHGCAHLIGQMNGITIPPLISFFEGQQEEGSTTNGRKTWLIGQDHNKDLNC